MKYFDKDGKHNFVDDNNVFVGYDSYQDCCENADFLLVKELPNEYIKIVDVKQLKIEDLEKYNFDTTFFMKVSDKLDLDSGDAVAFKLKEGENIAYLILYNSHNGYYSHGFTAKIGGIDWQSGHL